MNHCSNSWGTGAHRHVKKGGRWGLYILWCEQFEDALTQRRRLALPSTQVLGQRESGGDA